MSGQTKFLFAMNCFWIVVIVAHCITHVVRGLTGVAFFDKHLLIQMAITGYFGVVFEINRVLDAIERQRS